MLISEFMPGFSLLSRSAQETDEQEKRKVNNVEQYEPTRKHKYGVKKKKNTFETLCNEQENTRAMRRMRTIMQHCLTNKKTQRWCEHEAALHSKMVIDDEPSNNRFWPNESFRKVRLE